MHLNCYCSCKEMSGFCIVFLNEWNWCSYLSCSFVCLFMKCSLTVLDYRDDTHNIINCKIKKTKTTKKRKKKLCTGGEWDKFVLVTAQNSYRNKHTVLQLHFKYILMSLYNEFKHVLLKYENISLLVQY